MLAVTSSLRAIADPTLRLANASCYLDAFGHAVVAWLWLDMATAAARSMDAFRRCVPSGQSGGLLLFLPVGAASRRSLASGCSSRVERTPLDFADEWFALTSFSPPYCVLSRILSIFPVFPSGIAGTRITVSGTHHGATCFRKHRKHCFVTECLLVPQLNE